MIRVTIATCVWIGLVLAGLLAISQSSAKPDGTVAVAKDLPVALCQQEKDAVCGLHDDHTPPFPRY